MLVGVREKVIFFTTLRYNSVPCKDNKQIIKLL